MTRFSLKQKILMIVLGLTVVSQSLYLYVNVRSFREAYYQVIRTNLVTIGTSLKENLDYILSMGISLDKLVGLEHLLKSILSDAPELHSIALHDLSGNWLYYCDRDKFLKGADLAKRTSELQLKRSPDEHRLSFSLMGVDNKTKGGLSLRIDQGLMGERVKKIVLDSATVVVISILAIMDFLFFIVAYTITLPLKNAVEDIRMAENEGLVDLPIRRTGIDFLDRLLDHFDQYRNRFKEDWIMLTAFSRSLAWAHERQALKNSAIDEAVSNVKSHLGRFRLVGKVFPKISLGESPVLIRPAVFIVVFAESLSISFLPLYAQELYRPLWGLTQEVIIGLPISAFMFFVAVSLPVGGAWSDIVGRKKTFLTGALISGAGLLLTGTATGIVNLIVYRSLVGFGFGIVLMTVQGYIIDTTTIANRAEGMAMFLSAFYAGTLCGSAIGGMLADRVGFQVIFFMGGVLAIVSIAFLYLFLIEKPGIGRSDNQEIKKRHWAENLRTALPTPRNFFRLFSDRDFASLVFFQSIPNKICLIGFVYYLAPLFLKELGNSQSDTGRYVMGYSLIMILLSQSLSRWSDRHHNMKSCIFWGGTLSGLALIPFFFFANTLMVAIGIVLLGLAHSLSVSNQAKMALQLNIVQQIGLGQGLGLYRQAERVGNVMAPILLGVLASIMGYARSVALIGVYTVISSLLFLLASRKPSFQNSSI